MDSISLLPTFIKDKDQNTVLCMDKSIQMLIVLVGVMSFQKIYGLCGIKHQLLDISGDVFGCRTDGRTTREDRAIQLLI